MMLAGVPPASARATSSALAARTCADRESRISAMACSARSFWARVARASSKLASRARSATSRSSSVVVMGRAYVAREDGPLHVLSNGKQTPMTRADAPSPPPPRARVLLVGDSHLARLGPTVPALGEEVTNVARGGAFAHDLAGQVARRDTAGHDLVVLSVGTERRRPVEAGAAAAVRAHPHRSRGRPRCPVVLVSPPGVAESRLVRAHDRTSEVVGQYAGRAARVVLAAGGRVVDTPAVIAPLGDDAHLDDGVHLGPAAYALLLPALATAVREVLSAPPLPAPRELRSSAGVRRS